jgi:ubiquinone/menaquinone biosynthesis C-methylase UbiE
VDDRDRIWLEEMSEAYERWLVPVLFRPYAEDLAERVATFAPSRVLELAAGTGALTRVLVERVQGEVVASDLNDGMVTVGRRNAPGAIWRTADALALPFDDGEFELVVCQFGVMFFPDKRAGFAEVRRVLAPGGRFLFNTWGPVAENTYAAALERAIERVFPDDPPRFITTVPHGYHDPDTITADLEAAGFEEVRHVTVSLPGSTPSAAAVTSGFCLGSPLRAALLERGSLDDLTAEVMALVTEELGEGPLVGALTALVVEARS